MGRATGQRRDGKTAGVAITVQHVLEVQAPRMLGKLAAAVTLVQVKAGFVAFGNVQAHLPAVLGDGNAGLTRAGYPAGRLGQPFERAHAGIRALIQARESGRIEQGFNNHAFPALDTAA